MKSLLVKDLYYLSLARLSYGPYLWHRWRRSRRFDGAYVNLGCGPKYVAGMVNVDGNIFRKKDLWLDVSLGLPFPDDSVQGIYASHMVEHFRIDKLRKLMAECRRVLKPGGTLRLVVPSLEYAIEAFVRGDGAGLPDWPEEYTSIGGRFNNFMLCGDQHSLMFDFSFLQELLSEAGFADISRVTPFQSRCFSREHLEHESDPVLIDRSLYVECVK